MDLVYHCSVTVATDSQSVIDHSRRRGHSVASKHVGLRGLQLQESQTDTSADDQPRQLVTLGKRPPLQPRLWGTGP